MRFSSSFSTLIEAPDRDDPTPMYHQIRQDLENQMLLGKLPLGAQVPTEQSLCSQHGVSRITARRALEDLRKAGIIDRTRGRGSFVRKLPKGRPFMPVAPTEIGILTYSASSTTAFNDDSWGAQIIRGLNSRLLEDGFHATLLPSRPSEQGPRLWQRIDDLGPRLAGVMGFAMPSITPILDELDRRGVPWVTVNPASREQTHNFVSANNFAGGKCVAREFGRMGYRTSLFLSTDIHTISNGDRFFGFLDGWIEAGRGIENIRRFEAADSAGLNNEESARLAQLLAETDRPHAVFCGGDLLASSVLKVCQQNRLAVPEDVAVVGGTGMELAKHTSPTLTVLAQPMAELGYEAEAMLVEMIRSKQMRLPGRYIASPLISRDSCPMEAPGPFEETLHTTDNG